MKDRLAADLKAAMLARDSLLTDVIKGLKAAILNQEIADKNREVGLDDQQIETLFAREAKKRLEASELYRQGGNQAMADKEKAEYDIIMKYLPEQMSEAEISELVELVIVQNVIGMDLKNVGKVIGVVKKLVDMNKDKMADSALIAKVVKSKLQ